MDNISLKILPVILAKRRALSVPGEKLPRKIIFIVLTYVIRDES